MNAQEKTLCLLSEVGVSVFQLNKKTERALGMSLVQWCLLRQLVDLSGISALALSKKIGVHPSTLTQALKRLEKKGWISVCDDPLDSRRRLIALTRNGFDQMNQVSRAVTKLATCFDDARAELALSRERMKEATQILSQFES